ncbi:MAG: hypothetical protein ACKODQ_10060, partial [Betaproteobacteria bacterium]
PGKTTLRDIIECRFENLLFPRLRAESNPDLGVLRVLCRLGFFQIEPASDELFAESVRTL